MAIKSKPVVERWLEAGLFASRWLMAPFYVGLVVALIELRSPTNRARSRTNPNPTMSRKRR